MSTSHGTKGRPRVPSARPLRTLSRMGMCYGQGPTQRNANGRTTGRTSDSRPLAQVDRHHAKRQHHRAGGLAAQLLSQLLLREPGTRGHRHRGVLRDEPRRAVHDRRVLERWQPRRRGPAHRAGALGQRKQRQGGMETARRGGRSADSAGGAAHAAGGEVRWCRGAAAVDAAQRRRRGEDWPRRRRAAPSSACGLRP